MSRAASRLKLSAAFPASRLLSDKRYTVTATPAWATSAFAIAVFGGLLGSLFLLLRKNFAIILFTISLAGLLVQSYYAYVMADAYGLFGNAAVIQSAVILLIAVFLLWAANKAKAAGWSN